MTTLRDLLNDFAGEIIAAEQDALNGIDAPTVTELVDEYVETFKERIVG